MLKIIVTQIVSLFFVVKYANCELFTAVSELEPLLKTHQSVIDSLDNYLQEQKKREEFLKKSISRYKNEHKTMLEMPNYLLNPLNSFTLIKRLTSDLEYLENYIAEGAKIKKKEDAVFPTKEDLQGAADALSRLQQFYLLNTTDLANGRLAGTFSHGQKPFIEHTAALSSYDCFLLGNLMVKTPNVSRALEWFLEAYNKHSSQHEIDALLNVEDIATVIRQTYQSLGDFENAKHWTEKLIQLQPEKKDKLSNDLDKYNKELVEAVAKPNISITPEIERKHEALCRGELPFPEDIKKNLKCHYKQGPEPFLKLAPIKSEQLLLNPPVFKFHDVISDYEIHVIKYLAKAKQFQRSLVNNKTTGIAEPASFRISKHSWLTDKDSEVVAKVSRRVDDFTGLSMETAEQLQVANYGLGGYYAHHFDYWNEKVYLGKNGNRIATALFYISSVEQGGATVFMHGPGLTVFPVKNSAIFWYNMLPSGEQDLHTKHAGCPVLKGSKWVANKWIHVVGQEFRRPCTLVHEKNSE